MTESETFFESPWVHIALAIVVAIVVNKLLDKKFPIIGTSAHSKKTKEFWITTLTIMILLIEGAIIYLLHTTIVSNNLYSLIKKQNLMGIQELSNDERERFGRLIDGYNKYITVGQYDYLYIDDLAKKELEKFTKEYELGCIIINEKMAHSHISSMYQKAKSFIVATNYQHTNTFFDQDYINLNREQYTKQIAITRFYIYNSDEPLITHNDDTIIGRELFLKEVQYLHDTMKLYKSVVVDTKIKYFYEKLKPRDLMFIDLKYLSESRMSENPKNSEMQYDVVSSNPKSIDPARQYVDDLINYCVDTTICFNWGDTIHFENGKMSDRAIEGYFPPPGSEYFDK